MTLEELEAKRHRLLARLPGLVAAGAFGDPDDRTLQKVVEAIVATLTHGKVWRFFATDLLDVARCGPPIRLFTAERPEGGRVNIQYDFETEEFWEYHEPQTAPA